MRTLVIGGTGTTGSLVVRGLLGRGASVRVLTRSATNQRALPPGAEGVIGDLLRPATLPHVMDGIEAVFLATAIGGRETDAGLAAVRAARTAGIERLAYLSIFQVEAGAEVPHFASKLPIEREIITTIPHATILRAATFFQNDLGVREALTEEGVYPTPIGNKGVSSVDVRDIAEAAVSALLDAPRDTRIVPLVGPQAWTGPAVAEVYARLLRRPVRYAGDDLDTWSGQARGLIPEDMLDDLRAMYALFQRAGLRATETDVAQAEAATGHKMRTFEAFAAELVANG